MSKRLSLHRFWFARYPGAWLVLGLMIWSWAVCGRAGRADPPPGTPASPRRAGDDAPPDGGAAPTVEETEPAVRGFVRAWTVKDLRPELHQLGAGRSFESGKRLFKTAGCALCHRLDQAGGTHGPDLTGVAKRISPAALLREIIEPSKQIPESYQSHLFVTTAGDVHHGRAVRQDAGFVYLTSDPNNPDQLLKIAVGEIAEKKPSPVSTMPPGLINSLTKTEVLDLLAYVESGGREDHPAFDPAGEQP